MCYENMQNAFPRSTYCARHFFLLFFFHLLVPFAIGLFFPSFILFIFVLIKEIYCMILFVLLFIYLFVCLFFFVFFIYRYIYSSLVIMKKTTSRTGWAIADALRTLFLFCFCSFLILQNCCTSLSSRESPRISVKRILLLLSLLFTRFSHHYYYYY